jgi:hypothetical protein
MTKKLTGFPIKASGMTKGLTGFPIKTFGNDKREDIIYI